MLIPIVLVALAAFAEPMRPAPLIESSKSATEPEQQLLTVRRVFVDRLSGGDTAAQMRDMIMASLQNAKLFVITENQERADTILRGSAEDLVFTDDHSSSDGIHAQANFSLGSGYGNSSSGSTSGASSIGTSRYGSSSRDQRNHSQGMSVGDSESSRSIERKHEAVAAVRLVNKDGDVIWSTTQESMGGKFRGSSADVADKITKKLLEDYDRAKKLSQ